MNNKNTKKYLIVQGGSGLGNRIETTLSAILYAQLSKRILFIDWSDTLYSEYRHNVFNEFFRLSDVEHVSELPRNILRRSLRMPAEFTNRAFKRIDHPQEIIKVRGFLKTIDMLRADFKGEFRHYAKMTTLEILGELLSKNLILNEEIRSRVDDFKHKHFQGKMLGVHVRYTDAKRPLKFYDQAMNEMLNRHPESTIFLSTDNLSIIREYEKKHKKLITRKKWFPDEDGATLYGHRECPDRLQSGMDALVEMYLLAECDALIYTSYSTFTTLPLAISKMRKEDWYDIEQIPYFISVVIPLFNFTDLNTFKQCLEGLKEQSYPSRLYEVIVVHNGLTNEIKTLLAQFNVSLLYFADAKSSYVLRSKGMLAGKGEIFAILSPDCIPESDWIEKGVKALRDRGQTAALIIGKIDALNQNAKKRTAVELYYDFYINKWPNFFRSRNHKNFMERAWLDCQENLFFYRHVLEHTGFFEAQVKYIGDMLWWEGFKNKTLFFFDPVDSPCVRTPRKIMRFTELYKTIINFTDEYYRYKGTIKYSIKDFLKDNRFICIRVFRIYRWNSVRGGAEKIKIIFVLLFFTYARIARLLYLKSGFKPGV